MTMRMTDATFGKFWLLSATASVAATSSLVAATCSTRAIMAFALLLASIGPLLVTLTMYAINRRHVPRGKRSTAEAVMALACAAAWAAMACAFLW
jgi:hypothetical protein